MQEPLFDVFPHTVGTDTQSPVVHIDMDEGENVFPWKQAVGAKYTLIPVLKSGMVVGALRKFYVRPKGGTEADALTPADQVRTLEIGAPGFVEPHPAMREAFGHDPVPIFTQPELELVLWAKRASRTAMRFMVDYTGDAPHSKSFPAMFNGVYGTFTPDPEQPD